MPTESETIADELLQLIGGHRTEALRRLREQSISTGKLHVLMGLAALGPLTMTRLAELRDVSLPNATAIVNRMEASGLVERIRDGRDRRVVVVQLTEAGRNVVAELDFVRRRQLVQVLDAMAPVDRRHFADGIRAFSRTLTELASSGTVDFFNAVPDSLRPEPPPVVFPAP
jgi:DNA-binding MarR family transcriptional regulator